MDITSVDHIKSIKGDGILVRQIKDDEKTASGLYVPETVIEKRAKRRRSVWKAEVIKFGEKVDHEWLCPKRGLKKGDIVFCDPISLDCPTFDTKGEIYKIIKDADVMAMEVK